MSSNQMSARPLSESLIPGGYRPFFINSSRWVFPSPSCSLSLVFRIARRAPVVGCRCASRDTTWFAPLFAGLCRRKAKLDGTSVYKKWSLVGLRYPFLLNNFTPRSFGTVADIEKLKYIFKEN